MTSINKQLQQIEKEVGMEYQKEDKQGYVVTIKGQGSSLLLFVLGLWLLI